MIMMFASEIPEGSSTQWGELPQRPKRDSRTRRLALAQVRELRRRGLSYREIGRRFSEGAAARQAYEPDTLQFRLPPEPLLHVPEAGVTAESAGITDQLLFLRALDALDHGIVFFDPEVKLLHANRTLARLLESHAGGERLRVEVQHFATSLCGLVQLRELSKQPHVEELATREVRSEQARYRLKGSYIGLNLFGEGPSLLIALEKPAPDPLSDQALQERFGLSKKECGVLRLLIEGNSNKKIARALFLSPYTVRTYIERIFYKLQVHSRTEVATRVLRQP